MTARVPLSHLVTLASTAANRYRDRPAFTVLLPEGGGATLRYREVQKWSDRFAAFLQAEVGLKPGERVAVCLPNSLAFPVCLIGAVKAGAAVVALSSDSTELQLGEDLRASGASVLVALDERIEDARRAGERAGVRAIFSVSAFEFFPAPTRWRREAALLLSGKIPKLPVGIQTLRGALRRARSIPLEAPVTPVTAIGGVLFSEGTGGARRAVALSHRSLALNVAQVIGSLRGRFTPGGEVGLTPLPLASGNALVLSFLSLYWIGGHNVIVPSWLPGETLRTAFERFNVSWFCSTPHFLSALLCERWFTKEMAARVKTAIVCGSAVAPALERRWRELSGHRLLQGYGLAESGSVAFLSQGEENALLPVLDVEAAILDEEGHRLPPGRTGQIGLALPALLSGYLHAGTFQEFPRHEGLFLTGDYGTLSEAGALRVLGRKEEAIPVAGELVFPAEIEAVIADVPGVADVAVVGVPGESGSARLHACLVLAKEGGEVAFDTIRTHCLRLLPPHKVPASLEVVAELPLSRTGRLLRHELRQSAIEGIKLRLIEERMVQFRERKKKAEGDTSASSVRT